MLNDHLDHHDPDDHLDHHDPHDPHDLHDHHRELISRRRVYGSSELKAAPQQTKLNPTFKLGVNLTQEVCTGLH